MKIGLVREESKVPGLGSLYINYDGAANIEDLGERGLSHLGEHLMCKSYNHLEEELQSAGLVVNAFTSDTNVAFYWSGLDEKIEEFQEELLKLMHFTPTEEQFNTEKLIVMQEYEDYISGQNFVFSNISRKYFAEYGPIGYRDDIANCTYERMLAFIEKRFRKPTCIVRVGTSKKIDSLCKNIEYSLPVTPKERIYNVLGDETYLESPSTFPNAALIADWARIDKDFMSNKDLNFINSMFSSGLKSPFYQEIREKRGLVYYCGTDTEVIGTEHMIWIFYAGCKPDKIEEIRTIVKDCICNYKEFLTKERFDTILESMKNKIKMTEIENYKLGHIRKFFSKEEYIDLDYLNSLTYEHILDAAENFKIECAASIRFGSSSDKLEI